MAQETLSARIVISRTASSSRMPFGGVGHSGMGGYHGRDSFRCFTHDKSIVKKALWLDLPMRYTPYSKKKETLIRFFLK